MKKKKNFKIEILMQITRTITTSFNIHYREIKNYLNVRIFIRIFIILLEKTVHFKISEIINCIKNLLTLININFL